MTKPIAIPPNPERPATGNLLGVRELSGHPESAGIARRFVESKLGPEHPALETVTLLVSEAVTNSVVHSDSRDGGRITLALADFHHFVHVDVTYAGGETVPQVGGELCAEGGRGLLLVDALSRRWAVWEHDAGRTLWFQVTYTRDPDDSVASSASV
ncbi:ATP-binding protein [Sphaerisporangium sp. NPDC005288]|uniref:ATP-binding protein n=1 Tax=Sphaerisporangium sp. NPDC005288 TaxID=3155114 RepID=UPI0033BCE551